MVNLYSKIKRRFMMYFRDFTTAIGKISLALNGVRYGTRLRIGGLIKVYNSGMIEIGDHVSINSALWANPISSSSRTCFQVFGGGI